MWDKLKAVYVDERKYMSSKDLAKYIWQLCICLISLVIGLLLWESVIFNGVFRNLLVIFTIIAGVFMGHEILWGFRDDRSAVLSARKFFGKFWWLGFVFIGVSIAIMYATLIIL